jgi:hypothetical protein
MSNQIEYHGHVIEAKTRRKKDPIGWSLEVRIINIGSPPSVRRCRAPNVYPSKAVAVARCLEFGRRIVDGKLHPIS